MSEAIKKQYDEKELDELMEIYIKGRNPLELKHLANLLRDHDVDVVELDRDEEKFIKKMIDKYKAKK